MLKLLWIALAFALSLHLRAQTVDILSADQILRDPAVTDAQRLIGNVKLGHEDAVLTCDSAWRFEDGSVEVFSNVAMRQPPATTMTADYLQLQPNEEWAIANGEVELNHESALLQAPSLQYILDGRTARYFEGATILDDGWTVNSKTGLYRTQSKVLELGGAVRATNAEDSLFSDSLHWMRDDNRYRFHGPTQWLGKDVQFECQAGDVVIEEKPLGWLAGEVVVADGESIVLGDSLAWDESSREIWGNATLANANGDGEVHGHHAVRYEEDSLEIVHGSEHRRAWLQQIEDGDTLKLAAEVLQRRGETLTAFKQVTLVQENLVGQGDSLVWIEDIEIIQMWGTPQLWSNKDKLAGDTLTLKMIQQSPEKLEMRGHSIVLSPANDTLSHRIQGRDLDAFFEENELRSVDVTGNGEVVTFDIPEDGSQGQIRMNTAVCAKVTLQVVERELVGIALQQGPRGKIEPVPKDQDLRPFQVDVAPRTGPWETSEQGPLPE